MTEYRPTDNPNFGWISSVGSVSSDYTEFCSLDQTKGLCVFPEDFVEDDFQLETWDSVSETTSYGRPTANCFSDAEISEITYTALSSDTVHTHGNNSNSVQTMSFTSDSNCDTKNGRRAKKACFFKQSESQILINDDSSTVGVLLRPDIMLRKGEKSSCLTEQGYQSLLRHGKPARLSNNQTKHKTLCMTQNAVNARQNRIKRKQYEEDLETTVEQLRNENTELRKKFDKQMEIVQNLSAQVEYLNKVVANADKLGLLLQNIPGYSSRSSDVHGLSSSALITTKLASICDFEKLEEHYQDYKNAIGLDHNYACLQSQDLKAGICLHVATNGLAVEMCAICSQSAQKTFTHLRNSR